MKQNIKKQRCWHKRNFTIMHNEILFKKVKEQPISLEALGLFWRMMSFSTEWDFNIKGASIISGCCTNKIIKCLKELEDAGYLSKEQIRQEGKITGFSYHLCETTDPSLWTDEETFVNIQQEPDACNTCKEELSQKSEKEPEFLLPTVEKGEVEKGEVEKGCQYNIININNKIIKDLNNKSESDLKVTPECTNNIFNNNFNKLNEPLAKSCNTEKNEPLENLTLDMAQSEQKGSETSNKKPKIKKPKKTGAATAKDKKEARRQALTIERQQKIEDELNAEKTSVAEMVPRTIGDNTPLDNQLAQSIKNYNEAKEKNEDTIRRLNSIEGRAKRRQKIVNQIEQTLDRQIKHNDLNNELKTFFNMWNNIGKPLTMEIYEAQLKHLRELGNDVITQLRIVQQSIQRGWTGFYEIQTSNSYKHKSNPVSITVPTCHCNEEDYELAVDENGKPIAF
jgi:hypothetical protein